MIEWGEIMLESRLGSLLKEELIGSFSDTRLCSRGQLLQIIAYIKLEGLITYKTYEKLIFTLPARDRTIVAEYADGTIKYSRNMEDIYDEEPERNIDIFNPVNYLKWFIGELCLDENFRRRCPSRSFGEMVSNLDQYRLPGWIRGFFPGITQVMESAVLAGEYLFYLTRNDFGSYEFRRQPVPAYFGSWGPGNGRLIREGLGKRIIYNKREGTLYCPFNHIYACFRYRIKDGSCDIVYNKHFIGVTEDGREVYCRKKVDGEWKLCICAGGKNLVAEEGKNVFYSRLEGNRILRFSPYGSPTLIRPYWIDMEGNVVPCNNKKYAKFFWDYLLINDPKRLDCLFSGKISDALRLSEGEKALDELTLEKLQNSLNNAVKIGILQKSRCLIFKRIINLLESKGIDKDENCTEILYTLLKYSRLCQRNFFKKGYWDSTFCELLFSLAEEDNFLSLLYQNPMKLFKKHIYWTDEKEQEWEALLRKKGAFGRMDDGKIGYFDLKGSRLIYDAKPVSDGLISNNEVRIQNIHNYRGKVSYDLVGLRYQILWTNETDISDKVERAFHLKGQQYILKQQ